MIVVPTFSETEKAHKIWISRSDISKRRNNKINILKFEKSPSKSLVKWTMAEYVRNWINTPYKMQA